MELNELKDQGYFNIREIPGKGTCALFRFIYTIGLCVDCSHDACYHGRYCYHSLAEAIGAINTWDGTGDPPGDWVKYKGKDGERKNLTMSDKNSAAYKAGYDAGLNGPNKENCDHNHFKDIDGTLNWEAGNIEGKKKREQSKPKAYPEDRLK